MIRTPEVFLYPIRGPPATEKVARVRAPVLARWWACPKGGAVLSNRSLHFYCGAVACWQVLPIYNRGDVFAHVRGFESLQPRHYVIIRHMRVDKKKFDDLLGALLKAKPEPRKKIKTKGKHRSRPIRLK